MKAVRCAVYTRKSSEEGLEQAFNSLDAQRDACAAYVLSQASEGWSELPQTYDDGGLSGGSLHRPALQRLLADITAGQVDIVVVYKVDRLTRSLLDFSKLVEAFDKAGVSFVSVTQSFNTTTSMGRLTLNMLLSFAQFEREVTAERIRDKIAASKAKGMWMGGVPPLGYEPDGRTLKIVPEQAALVCDIYDRYLSLGNVRLLAEQLVTEGILSPVRRTSSGRAIGGRSFSRGQLYFMLKSPIYAGDIPHAGKTYPGQHKALIDRDTWAAVQARLAEQTQGIRRRGRTATESPLAGKVIDASGMKLRASHSCKGDRRYRYYIGGRSATGAACRIPARELDDAVAECIATALDDPIDLCARTWPELSPAAFGNLARTGEACAKRLRQGDLSDMRHLVTHAQVHEDRVTVECNTATLAELLEINPCAASVDRLQLESRARLKRSGHVLRLVQENGAAVMSGPASSIIRLVVKAHRWWDALRAGDVDVTSLARQEGVTRSYLTRVVRLAFLAPAVVEAILAGDIRADVDGILLTSTGGVQPNWTAQMERLLPEVR